jgi:ankyrin repeat protein
VYNASADQSVRCTAFSIAISNGHQAIAALLIKAGKLPSPSCLHSISQLFSFTASYEIRRFILTCCSALIPGADINTKFPFPTIKSVLKPVPASASAPTTNNNANSASDALAMPTAQPAQLAQSGGCDLTPILLACANGRLNVVRELLWRKCDCRYFTTSFQIIAPVM